MKEKMELDGMKNQFINKIFFKYKLFNKKIVQCHLNILWADNIFDIFFVFNNFRLIAFISIILFKVYPLASFVLIFITFLFALIIRYSLFHSSLEEQNFYGYYFYYLIKIDFYRLLIFFLLATIFGIYKIQNYETISLILYFTLNEIQLYFNLTKKINKFKLNKSWKESEINFLKKFSEEKYVNFYLLKNEINKE